MARPSTEKKVERDYWKKNAQGQWRRVIEQVSEVGYCAAIAREPAGWRKGARIRRAPNA
ncbi:MAG: hypothetical protein ACHP7P_17140 [Terriglobales bacterium]